MEHFLGISRDLANKVTKSKKRGTNEEESKSKLKPVHDQFKNLGLSMGSSLPDRKTLEAAQA